MTNNTELRKNSPYATMKQFKNQTYNYARQSVWCELCFTLAGCKQARIIGIGRKYVRILAGAKMMTVSFQDIHRTWGN